MLINVMEKGLVTLPKKIRDKLGISPGDLLDVEVKGDYIVLRPMVVVPKKLSLTTKGKKKEAEADRDLKAGRYKDFEDADSLLKELHRKD